MSCSKYSLTNTGNTLVNFNYQRCEDNLWMYQVDLFPNEEKNIWFVDGTFQISQYFSSNVVINNQGVFPPLPTQSPVPSSTPTNTPTPSVTPTITPTVTNTPTTTLTPTTTQTNTPTNTETPTVTPTVTITPSTTVTPTPSGFGTNNFKVTVQNSSRSIDNDYTLTEIPYVGSSGVGFTATTGTFPLSATSESSQTVYGTHAGIPSQTVTFKIDSNSSDTVRVEAYVDDSFYTGYDSSVSPGSNTVQLFVNATIGQTIEFIVK